MSKMATTEYPNHDPKDGFHHSQAGYLSSGFLTPASSTYEDRRESIASSQSSNSYAQSFSSSFYSPQMLPTPPPQRGSFADDFTFVQCPSSFDGASPHSADEVSFGECHQEAYLSARHSFRNLEDSQPLHSEPEWLYVQQPDGCHPLRSARSQQNHVLPAASDFSSAFNTLASACQSHGQLQSLMDVVPTSNPWTMQTSSTVLSTIHTNVLPYPIYGAPSPSLANSMQWPPLPSEQLFALEPPTDTMMPSDAIIQADEGSFVQIHSDSFEGGLGSYDSCSSPMPSSPQDVRVDIKSEQSRGIKEESEEDGFKEVSRSIYVSPTGGKGVKKESRSAGAVKKRSKSGRRKSAFLDLQGGPLEVDLDGDIEKDMDGKYFRRDGPGPKKLQCNMEFKVREGKFTICTKRFQRSEHPKRIRDLEDSTITKTISGHTLDLRRYAAKEGTSECLWRRLN